MSEALKIRKNDRLSISTHTTTPPRALTDKELGNFKLVADCLIPAVNGLRAGSDVTDFNELITRAAALSGAKFDKLMQIVAETDAASGHDELWKYLKEMSVKRPSDFYVLSTTVSAAYLYSAEMQASLNYPKPHQNPASMFDVADELSTGILDPVMERGRTYVDLDTHPES